MKLFELNNNYTSTGPGDYRSGDEHDTRSPDYIDPFDGQKEGADDHSKHVEFDYEMHDSILCIVQGTAQIQHDESVGHRSINRDARVVVSFEVNTVLIGRMNMTADEVRAKYGSDALPEDDMIENAAAVLELPVGR